MSLQIAAISPHPPILIPGVGNEEDLTRIADTTEAMKRLACQFKEKEIETVIIITPHGEDLTKTFNVYKADCFTCSLPGALMSFDGDCDLATKISRLKEVKMVESGNLDHGSAVPLYFLKEEFSDFKIVPVSLSTKSRKSHFNLGKKLLQTVEDSDKKIAVIASGDLSHKLTPFAPAGFSEAGKEFDRKLVDYIEKDQVKEIIEMDQGLIDQAGQCGYKSILTLLGALKKRDYNVNFLSYEGPFGVGYAVAIYDLL